MSKSEYFPRLHLSTPARRETLEGYETVEQFLARGGEIKHVPFGVLANTEHGQKITQRANQARQKAKALAQAGSGNEGPEAL